MKKQYVTGKNYDLGDGEISRVFSLTLRDKLIPMGNLRGGAHLKGLLILLLSHAFGRVLFPRIVPFEEKLHRFYLLLNRNK
ncbi:MAG: hypothetical protein D3916_07070 [Candidatus Electrothrix sp. MAN1_4]|nr:hypothetical protein [Candidatus Electrothrix sp. MAN1_4]